MPMNQVAPTLPIASPTEGGFVCARGLGLGNLRVKAYRDVDLDLAEGQAHAICGEGGSGKEELLLTLAGCMRPSEGSCTVAGVDLRQRSGRRRVRELSALGFFKNVNELQAGLRVATATAAELGLAGRPSGRQAVQEFLARWELEGVAQRSVGSLASFDRALLGIALAMAHGPRLLVVGDIESGMTEHQEEKLAALLCTLAREAPCTVVCGVCDFDLAARFDSASCITDNARAQRTAYLRRQGKEVA